MRALDVACFALLVGCSAAPVAPVPVELGPHGCPSEGWCWVRGRPMTVGGDRVRGSVYAIGAEGAFLRWDVDRWIAAPVPTRRTLQSAWVGSGTDAWVSDDAGSAWHFDGAAWTEAPAGSWIYRVMGAPDGSVWAIAGGVSSGHGGVSESRLLLREGDRWTQPMEPFAYCIGGDFIVLEDREVWSTGLVCDETGAVSGVEVHRYDGASWPIVGERVDGGWYPSFDRIDGRVRLTGNGTVEWDGTAWAPLAEPEYPQDLAEGETAFFDGFGYTRVPRSLDCESAYRLDAAHVWCVGHGQIQVNVGATWSPTLADALEDTSDAAAWGTIPPALWAGAGTRIAWGSGPGDVFRVRGFTAPLEHFDGSRWTAVLSDAVVTDIDGASDGDVWIATETGPVHYDGASFEPRPLPVALALGDALRVRALDDGRAMLVAGRNVFSYDGAWTLVHEAPENWSFTEVAGSSPDDVWVVRRLGGRTNEAALEHFDGATWTEVAVDGLTVFGELATSGSDTWLSSDGLVVRLGGADAAIANDWRALFAPLWIGPDALWLTTEHEARRYPLP